MSRIASKIGTKAFVFSALLGLAVIQPVAASFAGSPNAINNQTAQLVSPIQSEFGRHAVAPTRPMWGETGIYDRYDSYRGAQGFPLPGYSQLFEPLD